MKLRMVKPDLSPLLTARFLGISSLIAAFYLIAVLLLPNHRLVTGIFNNTMLLGEKISFLGLLLVGTLQSNPILESSLTVATALLVGLNLTMLLKNLSQKPKKSFHLILGGESLLGAVASGCSSCGTSILSTLAVGAGIGIAPFHLLLIQSMVVALLLYSFLRTLSRTGYCKIYR